MHGHVAGRVQPWQLNTKKLPSCAQHTGRGRHAMRVWVAVGVASTAPVTACACLRSVLQPGNVCIQSYASFCSFFQRLGACSCFWCRLRRLGWGSGLGFDFAGATIWLSPQSGTASNVPRGSFSNLSRAQATTSAAASIKTAAVNELALGHQQQQLSPLQLPRPSELQRHRHGLRLLLQGQG
jgi:hypothetical protein